MARRELDLYPTPEGLVRTLLEYTDIRGLALDPCSGNGNISDVLERYLTCYSSNGSVITNELNLEWPATYHQDATDPNSGIWQRKYNWVVMNPPFNAAYDILQLAWEHVTHGVASLLRLSFLEPTHGRGEWLRANQRFMSDLIVFGSPRPSFTDGGTDSVTTAWFVWQKEGIQPTRIIFEQNWR